MNHTHQRMRAQAVKHKKDITFAMGDYVWLNLFEFFSFSVPIFPDCFLLQFLWEVGFLARSIFYPNSTHLCNVQR